MKIFSKKNMQQQHYILFGVSTYVCGNSGGFRGASNILISSEKVSVQIKKILKKQNVFDLSVLREADIPSATFHDWWFSIFDTNNDPNFKRDYQFHHAILEEPSMEDNKSAPQNFVVDQYYLIEIIR